MLPIFSQKSNGWREYFNPLRGLSMGRVVSLIEQGERGSYGDLQWFYYFMERSDPVIFSVIQRRRTALMVADWDIKQVPTSSAYGEYAGADAVLAGEQVAFLRELYDGIDNFKDALAFLATGMFRGYAHVEKHYGDDGWIQRLEPVEQWFWVRDGMFGAWEYNENGASGRVRGLPIQRGDFAIFETMPLDRMLSVLYLRRNLSLVDWVGYLSVFGIPSVFLIAPPGATGQMAEFQAIAEELVADGRGALPNGSDIKYVTPGLAKAPYVDMMSYLDKMITLVGTGGQAESLGQSSAGILARAEQNLDVFGQLARGDAMMLSEVLQRDIDGPALEEAFPGRGALAYFEFAPIGVGDGTQAVQDITALEAAGVPVAAPVAAEKTGYDV